MALKLGDRKTRLARTEKAARAVEALSDASLLFAVVLMAALAIVALAVTAPLALAVSALAGLLFRPHERRRWRDIRPA
ncbi:MAG TPA: hypothetical protein VNH64_10725 [Parvularculaceae bacterium]|nr:hypothetical protein [Parvularculaceae bacterium]